MTRILIVDDELDLREILTFNLKAAGFEVDAARSAEEALELLTPAHALILLDVMMEGMSGFQMAQVLREERGCRTPIIFLTAKIDEEALLEGFATGGDDYIAKPFSFQEVLARVRAVLRRTQTATTSASPTLRHGTLHIDGAQRRVWVAGREIKLSPKEFEILITLAGKPGERFSREEILRIVWKGEVCVLDRTVDVHIARLRRKLGEIGLRLTNRQGYGYCFE